MCLILFAFKSHPLYKLIVAANRDEFYNRPTAPAAWWEESPFLLAGKDLKGGGTWMGITRDGKFAAITNYRSKDSMNEDALSRGVLISDYLSGKIPHDEFLERLPENAGKYNGFNLIFGHTDNLYYYSNRQYKNEDRSIQNQDTHITHLKPGFYGLSNAFLDTPWPKVEKGKEALRRQVQNGQDVSIEAIFSFLKDGESFPDETLPDTGVGIEYERMLSPLFIETKGYGTRSSTVILVDNEDRVTFVEKSFACGACTLPGAKLLKKFDQNFCLCTSL